MNYSKMHEIKQIIDDFYNFDIASRSRTNDYVEARVIFYQLSRELIKPKPSLKTIGRIAERDHSSIHHGLGLFDSLSKYRDFNRKYRHIRKLVIRNLFTESEEIKQFGLEDKVEEQRKEIMKLKNEIEFLKSRLRVEDPLLSRIPDEHLTNFIETRLKPYLKMIEK